MQLNKLNFSNLVVINEFTTHIHSSVLSVPLIPPCPVSVLKCFHIIASSIPITTPSSPSPHPPPHHHTLLPITTPSSPSPHPPPHHHTLLPITTPSSHHHTLLPITTPSSPSPHPPPHHHTLLLITTPSSPSPHPPPHHHTLLPITTPSSPCTSPHPPPHAHHHILLPMHTSHSSHLNNHVVLYVKETTTLSCDVMVMPSSSCWTSVITSSCDNGIVTHLHPPPPTPTPTPHPPSRHCINVPFLLPPSNVPVPQAWWEWPLGRAVIDQAGQARGCVVHRRSRATSTP